MNNASVIVAGIEYKIRKLIEQKEQLQSEREALRQNLSALKAKIESQEKTIDLLNQKIVMLSVHGQSVPADEAQHAIANIDNLLREIDKCINLLSN